jgi:hypothetical protein
MLSSSKVAVTGKVSLLSQRSFGCERLDSNPQRWPVNYDNSADRALRRMLTEIHKVDVVSIRETLESGMVLSRVQMLWCKLGGLSCAKLTRVSAPLSSRHLSLPKVHQDCLNSQSIP